MQTITVIARWEDRQMKPEDEWQLWRQLKGAFKVDSFIFVPILIPRFGFNQYETMEEALEHAQGTVCYLEPKGKHSVSNLIDIEGDITLVLGNTGKDNLSLANPITRTVLTRRVTPTCLAPTQQPSHCTGITDER